jgi:hypothetical protein
MIVYILPFGLALPLPCLGACFAPLLWGFALGLALPLPLPLGACSAIEASKASNGACLPWGFGALALGLYLIMLSLQNTWGKLAPNFGANFGANFAWACFALALPLGLLIVRKPQGLDLLALGLAC